MNSSQFLVIDTGDVLLAVVVTLAVGVDREGVYLVGSRRDAVAFEDFIPTPSFLQELRDLFAKEPRSSDICIGPTCSSCCWNQCGGKKINLN